MIRDRRCIRANCAAGGQHFTVAGDDEALAFCPLQFLDPREIAPGRWNADLHHGGIKRGITVSPQQRNEIVRKLRT
ncbi:MAG: hypothetical protein MRK00_00185 [Nitrosomonas sp.]|nr:hypothetical protein [Nitrosomonas sp.]